MEAKSSQKSVLKINDLLEKYLQSDKTDELLKLIEKHKFLQIKKFLPSAFAFIVSAIFKKKDCNFLIISETHEEAIYFYNDLQNILNYKDILFFPVSYRKSAVRNKYSFFSPYITMRSEVLRNLSNQHSKKIIVTYPFALAEKVPVKEKLKSREFVIKKGDEIDMDFLEEWLIEEGFKKVNFVLEPGQFAVRGSIIDIFSFAAEYPYRIDFFADEVEKIKIFNPETQLSINETDNVTVFPDLRTYDEDKDYVSFLDNLPSNTLIISFDTFHLKDILTKLEYRKKLVITNELGEEEKIRFVSVKNFFEILSKKFKIIEFANHNYFQAEYYLSYQIIPQPNFHKNFLLVADTLKDKQEKGYELFILSNSEKQIQRLRDILASEEINQYVDFQHIYGVIRYGFTDVDLKILVFTEHQIFGKYHRPYLKDYLYSATKQKQLLRQINELQPGDYVVHQDFGIGIFRGLTTIENNGKKIEVIRIDYKDNDTLYVNVHSLYKISKYKSSEAEPPVIHSLKSKHWKNLKKRAKSKVKDIARQLIALYAKRMHAKGYAFSKDTYLQEALEGSFMYEETPDQLAAIEAVKKDMEKEIPMDRLVCGDVGFGKTEVAVRAAFKAVSDGKQVAVLCPTTVLTFQHYKTFKERLKDFPVEIDFLSRLKKPKQQKETLKKLAEGKIDIIIGTHRLVSKDVKFRDLGLLIIDEEQRFGVAVKEKLRQLKVNVDTLTLTATPIPRTLEFSLMGARDLSVINTSPPNRRPIITELHTFNAELIKNAIELEISRGGQVFFVHNDISSLENVKNMIIRMLPEVRVALAHGKMKPADLEKVMTDFIDKKYDVLITTTIIENGLDIPNANTIIINNAHKFGLSQLHQLRGRVGRSERQAFCFLLAPPKSVLNSNAIRRLETIEMFSEIGSGFNIALQDLDIRGAGNLLGAEQSGFINDIGIETFKQILKEAMTEIKLEELAENDVNITQSTAFQWVADCQVYTDLDAKIPIYYINDTAERLKTYKDINTATSEEELEQLKNNLEDRFGKIPVETQMLFDIVRLRKKAVKLGIEKIMLNNGVMYAYFIEDQKSSFYDSNLFKNKILKFLAENKNIELKTRNEKLYLYVKKIPSVKSALNFLDKLLNY